MLCVAWQQTIDGEPLSACRARYLRRMEMGTGKGGREGASPTHSPAPPQVAMTTDIHNVQFPVSCITLTVFGAETSVCRCIFQKEWSLCTTLA